MVLVIFDAHTGLKAAIRKTFSEAGWQRTWASGSSTARPKLTAVLACETRGARAPAIATG